MSPAARATIAAILLALACDENEPPPIRALYSETFDETCDGAPCGWERVEGEPDQAAVVSGAFEGDRAIALRGTGVTVRGPGRDTPVDAQLQFGSLQTRLRARCDAGGELRIAMVVSDETSTTGVVDVLEGTVTPAGDWANATIGTLTASTALADGGVSGGPFGGTRRIRILAVTLAKTGAGECAITEIQIGDFGTLSPPPPETRC